MMAKMFYTLEEAKSALSKSEEDIKQFAREGRLREFRDGPRLMFKADQVEALKSELSGTGTDITDLAAADSGMAIGLADSKGGSGVGSGLGSGLGSGIGSGIGSGLSGSASGSGAALGLVDTDAGHSSGTGMTLKEDTALATDLGLSGSVGGMPSPGRPAGSVAGLSGTSQGSKPGVDVFQNDEVERVDPSAQTAIAPGLADMASEGVGSGSGLLDLTAKAMTLRSARNCSTKSPRAVPPPEGESPATPPQARRSSKSAAIWPMLRPPVEDRSRRSITKSKPTPWPPPSAPPPWALRWSSFSAPIALVTGVLDTGPDLLQNVGKYGFLGVAAGGLAVTLLFFVVGLVIGKTTAR